MKIKTKSLKSIIKSLKFDWVNSNIIDSIFPPKAIRGKVQILQFDKTLSSEEIIKLGEEKGLVPANIYELLEYAEDEWNSKDWVIALGSVGRVDGDRRVPYLVRRGSKRGLYLDWFDDGWDADDRFAFVRNVSSDLESSAPLDLKSLDLRLKKVENLISKLKEIIK